MMCTARSLPYAGSLPGGFCPGGAVLCPGGVVLCPRGSLSRGVSVGGLRLRGSLSNVGLCLGVFVQEVCPGGSLSSGGLCPGGLYQGDPLHKDPLELTWEQRQRPLEGTWDRDRKSPRMNMGNITFPPTS